MKKIFILTSLFIFLACINKKNVSIVELFETSQLINHQVFDIHGVEELLNPVSISTFTNNLIIRNSKTPQLFTIIDIESKRIIKHCGNSGQGPGEFLGVMDFYNNYLETGINIWDARLLRLSFYPYSDLMRDSIISCQNIVIGINDNEKFFDTTPTVMQIDSSLFFTLGGHTNKLFTLLDTKNNIRKEIGDYPPEDLNTQIHFMLKRLAYNGKIRYNKSLKKLVYISLASEMFEIYDINDSNCELVMGNYSTTPKYGEDIQANGGRSVKFDLLNNGNGENMELTISDENIYILYQTYNKEKIEKERRLQGTGDLVLVFDWNGNPIKSYTLDCFVKTIHYDKVRNRLFAIHDNPDPEIIYFEL